MKKKEQDEQEKTPGLDSLGTACGISKVLDPAGGAIAFHDAQITYNGIFECVENLKAEGIEFRAYVLPSVVFVIEIGDFPMHKNGHVLQRLMRLSEKSKIRILMAP